jgi:hypothetical protein
LSPTDFERFGLAGRRVPIGDRRWLLTIDFEGFDPGALDEWIEGMRHWASLSRGGGWRFSIFLAVEDVVRLRAASQPLYEDFVRAAKELIEAGTTFYPHNHGVFDTTTGLLAAVRPQKVPGYRKRASFAYDVVHRHGEDLTNWVARVVAHYEDFLGDVGIARPQRLAFRAGGWDHGDTAEMARAFVRAVDKNGFSFDSSASSGVFGTKSWRVGAPFGANVFALSASLTEVAPCWALNCAAGVATRDTAAAAVRLLRQPRLWLSRTAPGAFVTVLHFDHLFRGVERGSAGDFAPRAAVEEQVTRFFEMISFLRSTLHLESTTFEDLSLDP